MAKSYIKRESKIESNLLRYDTKGKLLGTSKGTKTVSTVSEMIKPYHLQGRDVLSVGKVFMLFLLLVVFARVLLNVGREDFIANLSLRSFLDFITGANLPVLDFSIFGNLLDLIPRISLDLGIFNFIVEGVNLWLEMINYMLAISYLIIALIWNLILSITALTNLIFA